MFVCLYIVKVHTPRVQITENVSCNKSVEQIADYIVMFQIISNSIWLLHYMSGKGVEKS